jgi:hypothetical protein
MRNGRNENVPEIIKLKILTMKKNLFFFIILLASCNVSSTRTNNQQDIDRGKIIGDKFFANIQSGSFADAAALCGGEAKPKDVEDLIISLSDKLGAMDEATFVSGTSEVKEENKKMTGEIDLNYTVKYGETTQDEDLVLKYVNDSLVIAGYHTKAHK